MIIHNHSNKIIEVKVGEKFAISLVSNPTTGYSWRLSESVTKEFCKLVGREYRPPEKGLIGGEGEEIWVFQAVQAMKTAISLEYIRPWKKDTPPLRKNKFVVIARE